MQSVTATLPSMVALLAEGVDRNSSAARMMISGSVALLAEGVDKISRLSIYQSPSSSPSSLGRRG